MYERPWIEEKNSLLLSLLLSLDLSHFLHSGSLELWKRSETCWYVVILTHFSYAVQSTHTELQIHLCNNVLHMQHHVPYISIYLFIWLQIVYCDSTDFISLLLRPMIEIESYLSIQLCGVKGLAQGPTDGLGVVWFELT